MKAAILADIHANLTALEAVLADIEQRGGADEIWCLGDIVGYGPDPHQCIEIVRVRCSICVAGNHDWAAAGKIDTALFNPEAAEAAQWTRRQLTPDDTHFLKSLPLKVENGKFTLAHGSPRSPIWEYILTAAQAGENLNDFHTPYCLIGHSHLPLLFECENCCTAGSLEEGTVIKLENRRLIINPGGVGQPRDHDPRASYAIYETENGTVAFHRVKYDISVVQRRMKEAGLPHWLINRLAYGR